MACAALCTFSVKRMPSFTQIADLRVASSVDGHLPLQHRAQLAPRLLALVQLLELAQRLEVLGVVRQHLLPKLDRDRRLLHLLGGELRHLDAAGLALVGVGELVDLALVDRDQLLPVAALLVHLLDEAERLAVVGIQLEDRLVGLDRLGLVRELLEKQVRDRRCSAIFSSADLDDRRLLAQQRDQIRPALHRLVLRGQRVGGVEVVGLDGEDLVERVDDHHIQLQTIAIDLDHLLEQTGIFVLGRRPGRLLDGLLQHLDEGVPALRLLVQTRASASRGAHAFGASATIFFQASMPLSTDCLAASFAAFALLVSSDGKSSGNAVAARCRGLVAFLPLPVALALALLGLVIHCAPPDVGSVPPVCSLTLMC